MGETVEVRTDARGVATLTRAPAIPTAAAARDEAGS